MFKGTTTARVLAITAMVSLTSLLSAQAEEAESINRYEPISSVIEKTEVSRKDARKRVLEFLKKQRVQTKLKVGRIEKLSESWKVNIVSMNRGQVITAYVDDRTGEITFKQ